MKRDSATDPPSWELNWLRATTTWYALPWWLFLAALTGGAYLLVGALGYGVTGFPLDDAWIHQTYARNLATSGQWAFVPGQTSAGSTAPLWSLLLSLGYWLGLPYHAWSYGLGIVALGLTGWTVARLGADLFPVRLWVGPLAGLFCVLEWHLVWAAVSGMETILYIWLSVLVVSLWQMADGQPPAVSRQPLAVSDQLSAPIPQPPAISHQPSAIGHQLLAYWWVGLLGGLLALTRPEGLVLVGLIGLEVGWRLLRRRAPGRLLRAWAMMGVGLVLPLVPYLTFHYTATGLPFPNTFYAKQQEYRALLSLVPFWQRWLTVASVTLVGGQVLLLPGFVYQVWRSITSHKSQVTSHKSQVTSHKSQATSHKSQVTSHKSQATSHKSLLLAVWWFVHLTLYALRLPVTYQHGRYQMPVIPFFILLGVAGMAHLLRPSARTMLLRVLSRAMIASIVLVSLAFLGLGARAYATDVAFIQGEMVATARWLEANVPPDSLIAVHDIGAVGYFTPRPLLDLAGLVTPEVIPFITDEIQLIEFMQDRGADYVVFFPDWSDAYRRMAQDLRLEMVYTTGFEWTLNQGHANMAVYRLGSP